MVTRRIALVNRSPAHISAPTLDAAAQALQTQVDRDFGPSWGVRAQVVPFHAHETPPDTYWPIAIVASLGDPRELGVHLDSHHRPYAQVRSGHGWTMTASHELLEMLADPWGHRFVHAPDIDPASDAHLVSYLVEVGDPCEVWSYSIGSVKVSDFVLPEFYDAEAAAGTAFDFLQRLTRPLEVPGGCYISWLDPEDGHWHQKTPDGGFVTAEVKSSHRRNPREERDEAFPDDDERHDLPKLLERYTGETVAVPA
jgi:hypothetical protein